MSHIVPDHLFLPFAATLIDGVPNCLYGDLQHEELEANLATANLPAANKNPPLINKAITKERVNHLSFTFHRSLARFIPNIGIIKLGIIDKPHKKLRMYRHGTREAEGVTNPINRLCDVKATEPEIEYGSVLAEHCQNLWSIATEFPGEPIDLYDDDVSGGMYHPLLLQQNPKSYYSLVGLSPSQLLYHNNN